MSYYLQPNYPGTEQDPQPLGHPSQYAGGPPPQVAYQPQYGGGHLHQPGYPAQYGGAYPPQDPSYPPQYAGGPPPQPVGYQPQYGGAPPPQAASYPPQQHAGYPTQAPTNPHGASIQYAPVPMDMSGMHGVVVRQKAQKLEALAQTFGVPYEAANKYRISAMPPNKVAKKDPEDRDGWEPTGEELEQLDAFMFAHEESDSITRTVLTWLGCKSLRPLKMHFSVANGSGDVYFIDRPFKLGGICCSPLEMTIDAVGNGQPRRIGRVREDFSPYLSRCCTSCCLATTYTDIDRAMPDGSYEKRYSLRTNLWCCGRVNNCCGGTCFQNDAVYDILDTQGEIVAHLQRTYASSSDGASACCRMSYDFNNYILEFPRDSTAEDRMLLLTALFQVEYQLFEVGSE